MFTLKIETGNAAMCEPEHVADALREVADKLDAGEETGGIRDENGNTVGEFAADWINRGGPTPEERHLAELKALGYVDDDLEALDELEERAEKAAEDHCNVPNFDWDRVARDVEAGVAELFGGDVPAGFFVNGDPRGYALKLQEGTGAITYRDWGGFEILAPDFD